jgi:hypothetical protein
VRTEAGCVREGGAEGPKERRRESSEDNCILGWGGGEGGLSKRRGVWAGGSGQGSGGRRGRDAGGRGQRGVRVVSACGGGGGGGEEG